MSSHQNSSSSTKKAGNHHHTRNPMACTNCRARKIKCESNRQYPDRPCQRCTNRKLRCEYVAISHPPPPTPKEQASPNSNVSSFNTRQPHTQAPSAQPLSPPLRYSPLSYTSTNSRSPRTDSGHISRTQSPYPLSIVSPRFSYASRETSSPAFYDTYYSAGTNYDPSTAHMSATPRVSDVNLDVRINPTNPRNADFTMSEAMQHPGQIFGQNYVDWSNIPLQDSLTQEHLYYSTGECHCFGMQCTCGRRRTSTYWPSL
ncbi:hypothetical protein K435DRAFT_774265 [Dendrothele bispora CBS 962.96]|uniref:Zn(2)-C6 fungal-type domain-containing protein n=1 Tax=Dendrothele bispora (strain CBS 962.96) TaxID=1314807 RepID=A0A4S8MQ41_DENBC|nr:hypothetical protein K435DRAFT_774265 [Dendrothele bispora CBS 962.96]